MKKLTAYHIVLAFFILIILLLIGFYGITYQSFKSTIRESSKDAETLTMMRVLESLGTALTNLESAQRGYVITGDKTFIGTFDKDVEYITLYVAELRTVKKEDAAYNKQLVYLDSLVKKKVDYVRDQVEYVKSGNTNVAVEKSKILTGLQLMEDLKQQILSMENEGRQSLKQSAFEKREVAEKANRYFIYLGAAVIILLIVFYLRIWHDFKRRLQAESQLRKLNDKLSIKVAEQTAAISETFERITDAVVALDKNWNFTFINQQALKWVNLSKEDLLGKNIGEAFPAIQKQPVFMYLSEAIHSQEKVYFSEHYEPLDLWIEGNIYPSPQGVSIFLKNITEEKKATAELFRQKKLSDQLIELLPGAVYLYDETGKFIRWSHQLELLTGYTPDEIRKLSHPADLYVESSRQLMLDRVTNVFANKGVPTLDMQLQTKNGSEVYVALNSTLINYDGKKCLLGVAVDITDKKKAELKIRDNEIKYKSIFENSLDGILLSKPDGTVLAANPSACYILQRTEEEICQVGREEIAVTTHPDFKKLLVQRDKFGSSSGEVLMRKGTGEVFPVETSSKIYTNAGGELMTINVFRDITEKKKTEEALRMNEIKFRKIFESDMVGFLFWDENFNIIDTNDRFLEMIGFTRNEILSGLVKWKDISAPEYDNLHEIGYLQLLQKGFADPVEKEYIRKDGSRISVIVGATLLGENMKEKGVAFIMDISELKKAEAVIKASEEKYRTLIERISDGFISLDKDWCYTYANTKVGDMVKMNPQTLVGKNVWELFPDAKGSPTYKAFHEAMEEQQFIQHIDYYEPLDLWQENSIYPSADGISVFIRDISEQRRAQIKLSESERTLRHVLTSIVESFYVLDKNYCFKLFNERTARDFKILSGKNISIGTNLIDLVPADRKLFVINNIKRAFNGEIVEYEANHIYHQRLAEWYAVSYVPVMDDAGEISSIYITYKDISARKRAEELERKTIEHQALFTSIVNYSDDAIISKTTNSIITSWNKGAEKMFGYTAAEAIGKSIHLIIPKEAASEEDFIMSKIKDGEHVEHYETLRIKKDGSLINISLTVSPILGADGNINGASAIARDITERKKAEQSLLVANQRFMLISKATKDFVWDYDLIENKVWWNENYYKELGWEKSKHKPEVDSWEKYIHPDDKQRVLDKVNDILIKSTKSVWTDEYRFAKLDGSYIHVLDRGFIIRGSDGKPARMLGAMTDITTLKEKQAELRRSEQKYKILFQNNPMPLWMFEHDTYRFVDVNNAALNRYGYSREEFLSMNIMDIRPKNDVERLELHLIHRYNEGVSNAGYWKHIKKDGTEILVEVYSHDTLYDGKLVRLVLPVDVTDRIRAEEELLKSREDIRNLAKHLEEVREEERTGIAREIHDELGQQLTVLKMDVSWLNKRVVQQDDKIKDRFREMEQVIDETVKTIRRISSELRPSVLDNLGIIAALEWQCNEFENRTGIVTTFSAEETAISLPVKTANGVFRIFQESLTNIARHANATEADVSVNFQDGTIVLQIKDNGNGFSREKVAAKKTLGILGMTERALLLNGKCNITSKPGKGTLVEVIIPVT